MNAKTRSLIKRYLSDPNNINDNMDWITGEINCTALAEDAIHAFNVATADDEDIVYDMAVDAADRYERTP